MKELRSGNQSAERWGLAEASGSESVVGSSVPRIDAARFVRGAAAYLADVDAEGALEAIFVRSTIAHGLLREVDLTRATTPHRPDVVGMTGLDVASLSAPMPAHWEIPTHANPKFWCLAVEKVRYIGDPVAIVAAPDRSEAEAAAQHVVVKIDPLPVVVDALVAGSASDRVPILYNDLGSNILYEAVGTRADGAEGSYPTEATGITSESLAQRVREMSADQNLQTRFMTAGISAMPMEPRGCLAVWTHGTLKVTASTQTPLMLRRVLADVLHLPELNIEVVAPDVGGGFGAKIGAQREEIAVCLLAMHTGRPVRWLETSVEHLQNGIQARREVNDVVAAYDSTGRIVAFHVDSTSDAGAYSYSPLSSAVEAAALPFRLPSIYDLGEYSYHTRAVMTNKPTGGTYRGVAAPVGVFVVERVLQDVAWAVGQDFAAVQELNLLPEMQTGPNSAGVHYDAGQYRTALAMTLEHLNYRAVCEEREERRRRHDRVLIGIGLSAVAEPSAVSMDGLGVRAVTDWEEAYVRVNPDCSVDVRIAAASSGQAHETTFAQMVSEVLCIDPRCVRVAGNSSGSAHYGSGSWGSRVSVISGGAVVTAAEELAGKIKDIGASLLGTDGEVSLTAEGVRALDGRVVSLEDVCRVAYFQMSRLPRRITPGLSAVSSFRPAKPFTSPYAWHGVVCAVDTLTSEIRFRKYVVVGDSGRVINPALLDEQVRGGVAQGLGQALLEFIEFNDAGQSGATDLFRYRTPRATDVPEIEVLHVETLSPGNVFGVRGGGEDGPIGAPAAIATALSDALRPVGFVVNELPLHHRDFVHACLDWQHLCNQTQPVGLGAGDA